MRLEDNRLSPWVVAFRRILFVLFLIEFGLIWVRLWRPDFLFGDARWPEGLLLVLIGATTLASLSRQLPGQNVLLASIIIVGIGGAVQSLDALTGIPFGHCVYTEHIGPQLFEPVPWAVPVLWLVAVLTCRGVARLILRPWRSGPHYGFWLWGVSVVLIVIFDLGLEPFATQVKHYWVWSATKLGFNWYSAPWVNFVGWALTAAVILAFVTPTLINKKPVNYPPDYHPLTVWLLVSLLFATGAAHHQLWTAFGLTMSASLLAVILALRGAWPGGSGAKAG